jgi:hypothetical protein
MKAFKRTGDSMDTTQELRSEARFDYFKALDDCVDARLVTVDVGRDRPDARVHDPRPLRAMRYDPETGVLHLAVGGSHAGDGIVLRHFSARAMSSRNPADE